MLKKGDLEQAHATYEEIIAVLDVPRRKDRKSLRLLTWLQMMRWNYLRLVDRKDEAAAALDAADRYNEQFEAIERLVRQTEVH